MTAAELVERVKGALLAASPIDHWLDNTERNLLARAAIAETLATIREIIPARDLPMIDALAAEIREWM